MKKWLVLGAVAVIAVLAAGSTASAEMGVGVKWSGNGLNPDMVLPIKMGSDMVIEPWVGFSMTEGFDASATGFAGILLTDPKTNEIRVGVSVEKQTLPGGTTPIFGGYAGLTLNSLTDVQWITDATTTPPTQEDVDSWMDFEFGVFVGGSASLADNVDIVGKWGPSIMMNGAIEAGSTEIVPSTTNIGSTASITFRWWLWGM